MQMTDDLIRSVVQQVLSQMGNGAAPTNGTPRARPSGTFGVYPTADAAVAGGRGGLPGVPRRPLDDRRKAVELHPQDLHRAGRGARPEELEETKIGRLDHKIEKLRDVDRRRIPGVEFLRTDDVSRRQRHRR